VAVDQQPVVASIDVVRLSAGAERAFRCGAALVDRSDRGKLALTGDAAADCLNGQVTNDVTKVEPGCGQLATFLTTKGAMLGDLRIIRTADTFELDTERVSLQALFDLLRLGVVGHDAELHKRTLQRGLLSLVGPRARVVAHVEDLGNCEFKNAPFTVNGLPAHAILTEHGVDILCEAEHTAAITATLVERGATTVAEAEYEVARISKGRPRYGVELDERTMPQEAGLNERAVSFTKGCYVGQEIIARMESRGRLAKVLRGLRLMTNDEGRKTKDDGVEPLVISLSSLVLPKKLEVAGKEAGDLTSVVVSPRFGPIGLAYVRSAHAAAGTLVGVAGSDVRGEVVELPFDRLQIEPGEIDHS
jgi:tRNA-modifying protein YgfZ